MSVVLGQIRASITHSDGTTVNLAQAGDFTAILAETRDFAFSGDEMYTFVDTIVPRIQGRVGSAGLRLVILGRNRHEDTLQELATYPLDLDDKPIFTKLPSFVYYRARLVDDQLKKRWILYGFEVFGEADGGYF